GGPAGAGHTADDPSRDHHREDAKAGARADASCRPPWPSNRARRCHALSAAPAHFGQQVGFLEHDSENLTAFSEKLIANNKRQAWRRIPADCEKVRSN